MAGTVTPIRGLYKPLLNEQGWGDKVNANFDNLDTTTDKTYVDGQDAATLATAKGYTDTKVAGVVVPVTSVAGKTGAVVLVEGDIANLVTDLAAKEVKTAKGVANGYAALDAGGVVPSAQSLVRSVAGKTGAVVLVESDIANLVADLAAKASITYVDSIPNDVEPFNLPSGDTYPALDWAAGGSIAGAPNQQWGMRFLCNKTVTCRNVAFYLSASVAGGKYGIALYSGDGLTKLGAADAIDVSSGTNVAKAAVLSAAATLQAGSYYWMCWVHNDATTLKVWNALLTNAFLVVNNLNSVCSGSSGSTLTSGGLTLATASINTPALMRVPVLYFW